MASQPRGSVVLTRSPFRPAVIGQGVLAAVLLTLGAAAIGWPLAAETPIGAEVEVLQRVDLDRVRWLHGLGLVLSYVGHIFPVSAVAIGVALAARQRLGSWDVGLLLLVVLGGASVVTAALKLLTARVRPDGAVVTTFTSAYPSGHAVRAAAVYGLVAWVALRLTRRAGVKVAIVATASAVVAANAVVRVALSAHWPTDVLVGVALGALWLGVSLWLLQPHVVASRGGGPAPQGDGPVPGPAGGS